MDVTQPLARLETTELIRRLDELDLAYLFKHALVQDTAYTSLLKNERKRLHRLIGATLERAYPDALDENAARLTQHYIEAGDDAKIFQYALRAGDYAARVNANAEAILFYTRALQVKMAVGSDALRALYTKLGRMYEVTGDYARALETYQQFAERGDAQNDAPMKLHAWMQRATLYATPTPLFDPAQGQMILDEALTLARALNDRAAQAKLFWNLSLLHGFSSRPESATEYGEQAVALARELNLKEQLAYALNDLGTFGYFQQGRIAEGRAATLAARALFEELGNLPMLADNLNNSAIFFNLAGDYKQGYADAARGHEISVTIGNVWGETLGDTGMGAICFERGEMAEALTRLERAYHLAVKQHLGLMLISATNLAMVYAELGQIARGVEVMELATSKMDIPLYHTPSRAALAHLLWLDGQRERAASIANETCVFVPRAFMFMPLMVITLRAELFDAEGTHADAVALFQNWAEFMHGAGLKSHLSDVLYYLARAQIKLGVWTEAEKLLHDALARVNGIGCARLRWKILAALGEVCAGRGEGERARGYFGEARENVERIAAGVPEEYRAGFLERCAANGLKTDKRINR